MSIVFWIIILNIVIAMMLDIFSNVSVEMDKEFDQLEHIKKLQAKQR